MSVVVLRRRAVDFADRLRVPRPTIRLRLTLLFGALFLLSGAALLGVTYLLVSNATSDPLVYRGPDGAIAVRFDRPPGLGVRPESEGNGFTTSTELPPGASLTTIDVGGVELQQQMLQDLAEQQHAAELNQLVIWSGVALAMMAVISVGIGWFVAGRVLSPLRAMTADVRQISATNLHRHLELSGPDDEIHDLGSTFNDLLRRLERSFDAQRLFVASASHELRTPLARQRTLLQVALDDPDLTLDSLRATAKRVLVAGDQQEKLVEALFTLARGERGLQRREPVDLGSLTRDVLHARHVEIEEHGLRLDDRLEAAPTWGDASLVERLVANLIDNAMRYNTPEGRIEVATASRKGSAILRVVNSGPVVPAAEVDRLFQPFQRLSAGRTHQGDGWGLGLSIVRAIASTHGATVEAKARPEGGLAVEVIFPARHS